MFVKICGNTNEADALLAIAMGADSVGFIFAPSPRQVTPTIVGDIVKRLPPGVLSVGVFKNESPARVVEIVRQTGLRAVQLHGRESARDSLWIRDRVPFLIKVFPTGSPEVAKSSTYGADVVMFDGDKPGSGQQFDWKQIEGVSGKTRLLLAGGLNDENVASAIEQVKPWGVDVTTGIESEPGKKDPRKLRAFIAAVREAEPKQYNGVDEEPFDWEE